MPPPVLFQVRLGARRHIETETPEQLYEMQRKQQFESQKKEDYASELRQQMLEKKTRENNEKMKNAKEDERLSRKVHMAFEEERLHQKKISDGMIDGMSGGMSGGMSDGAPLPPSPSPLSPPPTLSIPSSIGNGMNYNSGGGGANISHNSNINSGRSPTGLAHSGSGDIKWKGFTRFKQKDSLDPQVRDDIARKQLQQEKNAEALREQIQERKRREKERQMRELEAEAQEERRIERDRQELSEQFSKQKAIEKAKREKKLREQNPEARISSTNVVHNIEQHVAAAPISPGRPTTAEHHRQYGMQSPAAVQRSSSAPVESPQHMSEEHRLFRQEMQQRQHVLEQQLQQQQDLVKMMSEQMERAMQQQQQQPQQPLPPPPQQQPQQYQQQQQAPQTQRRQWNVSPSSAQVFASVDSQSQFTQPSSVVEPSFENGYSSYDDAAFQQEFQKAYAMNNMGVEQLQQPQQPQQLQQPQQPPSQPQVMHGLPPRPTPSATPMVRPFKPVDPAFQSRPKIMNSLDGPQLQQELQHASTMEESLSGKSKLIQLKQSTSMHTWNEGPLTAQNMGSSNNNSSNNDLPPRPTSSSPTRRTINQNKTGIDRRSRNWEVEKSLASSSKLIFMKPFDKNNLPSIDERHPTGSNPLQPRPGTAGSLTSVAPGAPALAVTTTTAVMEKSTGSSHNSSNSSNNSHNSKETVSDLPSMAWDENAPPADHPLTNDHMKPSTSSPTVQQRQRFTPSPIQTNTNYSFEDENDPTSATTQSSSPSMRVVADFLGVDPTSPLVTETAAETLETGRPPSTPPREEFESDPPQFRVHTPTYEDIQIMEKTVVGGAQDGSVAIENTFEDTFMGNDTLENSNVPMGNDTMKYVAEMNRANVEGGSTDINMEDTTDINTSMEDTTAGMKNTMGMTKQWNTLEVKEF